MNPDIQKLWKDACSLKGCLQERRQETGRRKQDSDEDAFPMAENPFVSDEAKLKSSKVLRNLAHKTQVFTLPRNSLVRTRRTHVDEVEAISVVAASMLGLNIDLTRAAAIGHDIGHVPFGHQGEHWMAKKMGKKFCHEVMGPIVVQKIERKGEGLNLCYETLDAMMRHSGNMARKEMTQEAWTLRYTDKFAYLFADYNDIIRFQYPMKAELTQLMDKFGKTQRERVTTAIAGLVIESAELGHVSFEQSELAKDFQQLRQLMYEVYVCVTQQNVAETMESVFEFLSQLNVGDPFLLLALMTDNDVIDLSKQRMKDISDFNRTAVSEIVQYLPAIGKVDLCDPGLDW